MESTSGLASANTTKTKHKSSVSETGHAKNIAHFQELIAFVTGYGATYNPSKEALKIPQLNAIVATAETKLADVITKNTAYNNAVNDRVIAFSVLKGLSTRLVSALQTTNAPKEKISDAKGFNRKMQGGRAAAIQTPTDPNAPAPNTISTSQQSYDQLIQHFAALISVLESETSYQPNENDLKVATLTAKQAELIAKNNAVITAYINISNSRIQRNKTLYDTTTGLVDTALEVKKYVKSVYGATSPEYDQIKGILFKKEKR
ncbi:hypothetical protein [Flavobacterium terrigena]|uniref:Uncharacterized protein n=1 Tax=Flavobacterium terrigena TaxID=402734 RepID=A0A1H6UGN6_9FLAO|nr:hypothetical protein [Flavobacterium terrigena]SEI91489.1 hypothetical protein SAMN05660918_1906 [Flavobacterium terrigena]